jgi:hypothetical protein
VVDEGAGDSVAVSGRAGVVEGVGEEADPGADWWERRAAMRAVT